MSPRAGLQRCLLAGLRGGLRDGGLYGRGAGRRRRGGCRRLSAFLGRPAGRQRGHSAVAGGGPATGAPGSHARPASPAGSARVGVRAPLLPPPSRRRLARVALRAPAGSPPWGRTLVAGGLGEVGRDRDLWRGSGRQEPCAGAEGMDTGRPTPWTPSDSLLRLLPRRPRYPYYPESATQGGQECPRRGGCASSRARPGLRKSRGRN